MVLGLDLVNYFDTSIGSLHFSSVDMTIGIMIGTLMGTLLENYLGSSIEAFLGTWNGLTLGTHLGVLPEHRWELLGNYPYFEKIW